MGDAERQVRKWLADVVIGFNFCPFARREFEAERIRYLSVPEPEPEQLESGNFVLEQRAAVLATTLLEELALLDRNDDIETTLLIFEQGLDDFHDYLDLLGFAQGLLSEKGYEGVYQLASFHPRYVFAGSDEDDAANATNRSPLPLIHILRESSVAAAIERHKDTYLIPERNVRVARDHGLEFWESLSKSTSPPRKRGL